MKLLKNKTKTILLSFFLLIPCALLIMNFGLAEPTRQQKQDWQRIIAFFQNQDRGYEKLKKLTSALPHRYSGSIHGFQAEQMLFNALEGLGLKTGYQPFSFQGWFRGQSRLEMSSGVKPSWKQVKAIAMAYTPADADVTATVVDLNDGFGHDFTARAKEIANKIVLINIYAMNPGNRHLSHDNPHRVLKAAWALQHGAKGIIFVHRYEKLEMTGTVSRDDQPIGIPAVCISFGSARELRQKMKLSSVTARIRARHSLRPASARNIIASWPGQDNGNGEKIVIGAHLDTWDLSPGAIDNGIGAMTVYDIARAVSKLQIRMRRSVDFVFFMAEEMGQLGSTAYVKEQISQGSLASIRYYINIDMTGNPRGLDIEGRHEMASYFLRFGGQVANVMPYANMQQSAFSQATDTVAFAIQGIATVQMMGNLSSRAYRTYHSNEDHFNLVERPWMQKSATFMTIMMTQLANEAHIPANRLSKAETKYFLQQNQASWMLTSHHGWSLR